MFRNIYLYTSSRSYTYAYVYSMQKQLIKKILKGRKERYLGGLEGKKGMEKIVKL